MPRRRQQIRFDPRILIITSAIRVQSDTAPVLTELMEDHHSVSRTLQLLGVDINVFPERMLPVDIRLFDRITSLVGQVDVDLNTPLLAEDE